MPYVLSTPSGTKDENCFHSQFYTNWDTYPTSSPTDKQDKLLIPQAPFSPPSLFLSLQPISLLLFCAKTHSATLKIAFPVAAVEDVAVVPVNVYLPEDLRANCQRMRLAKWLDYQLPLWRSSTRHRWYGCSDRFFEEHTNSATLARFECDICYPVCPWRWNIEVRLDQPKRELFLMRHQAIAWCALEFENDRVEIETFLLYYYYRKTSVSLSKHKYWKIERRSDDMLFILYLFIYYVGTEIIKNDPDDKNHPFWQYFRHCRRYRSLSLSRSTQIHPNSTLKDPSHAKHIGKIVNCRENLRKSNQLSQKRDQSQ